MQIQMQAFGTKSTSLRKLITEHLREKKHPRLYVKMCKDNGRPNGWAKIAARGVPGCLNIGWQPSQQMLLVRANAEKGNRPDELLGVFLGYLLENYGKRVSTINVQLT